MKAKRTGLKISGLILLTMAALMTLTILGCEEEDPIIQGKSLIAETEYLGYVTSGTFKVQPEGTEVSVLGGSVVLSFPAGSVSAPTLFIIGSLSTDQLDADGINMYEKGFYLEGDTPYQPLNNVTIQVKYDLAPESWKMNPPEAEKDLTINLVYPDFEDYQGMHPLGDCCVDSEAKVVKSSIHNCGYFLVSEK